MRLALAGAAILLLGFAPGDQYRPFDYESTEIIDDKTGLTWERKVTLTRTFSNAEFNCTANFAAGRVPTLKELYTLVDEEPHDDYEGNKLVQKAWHDQAFDDSSLVDKPYWSSTPTGDPLNTPTRLKEVWGVDFRTGNMVKLDAESTDDKLAYARCVR
jgi:hypothetical protein